MCGESWIEMDYQDSGANQQEITTELAAVLLAIWHWATVFSVRCDEAKRILVHILRNFWQTKC
jgi:hypothetical protein